MKEQRRLVTVVFADVVGSTALAEELDPEDVRTIFSRYYAVANEVIAAHGGIVAKLLGDGVLACFGIPTAHGDDATRALDATLVLRNRVAGDPDLERLQLRIGVNTGEVLANEDASGEIVGDAVNIAARVAAAAGEGEILAAESTHRAAAAMSYGDPRDIAAKGKSQPVRVWPLRGRGEGRVWVTPFVGREDDLAQLELIARRAFRDERPHLVTITAPTGIGKSRLAQEFHRLLGDAPWYAHAHCAPYGESFAYAPLRELLLELLALSPDAPADDVRRAIGGAMGGEGAERAATLVAASVAAAETSEMPDSADIAVAWRALIARLAGDRPLLIVLEDLQNASDSLLELIERMALPAAGVPAIVLCLARPELLVRRSSWGGGWRNSLNLSLEPLRDEDIGDLVARLLEADPPPALRDLVVERAAGNPFFTEELVRSLLDRGPIDLHDPESVARALRALPETVQATLLSRLDMLAADERLVVQAAAVAGVTFSEPLVRVVSGLDDAGVGAALERLAEREFVQRGSGDEWSFRNALVRDVAYGTLPRARRIRDHLVLAKQLESTAGERADELASAIGMHYLEATRLRKASAVGPGADAAAVEEARHGAVTWLTRGGNADRIAGAWEDAVNHFADAAAIATDDERVLILTLLNETASGGDKGWDAGVEALRLWRARPDGAPLLGARIITSLIITQVRSGISVTQSKLLASEELEALAAEGLELAQQSRNELSIAAAHVIHAYLERERSHRMKVPLEPARDEAAAAAAVLERGESWNLWSIAMDAVAALSGDLGDFIAARDAASRRVEKGPLLGSFERPHTHWTMPLYLMVLGDVPAAREHLKRALTEPAFVNSRWAHNLIAGQIFLLSWRAAVNWALGEWDACIADAREIIAHVVPRLPDNEVRSLYRDAGCSSLYAARRRGRADLAEELSPLLRRWCDDERSQALLNDDPSLLDVAIDRVETAGIDLWQVERSLSLLAAYRRVPVGVDRLSALIAWCETRQLRPLIAQLLRLRAMTTRSSADAKRAHELLMACAMRADAALAGVEMAEYGDRSALPESRAELERLGDRRGLAAVEALG